MSLKSPITYAEWYWKHSVDAEKQYYEDAEKDLAVMLRPILTDVIAVENLPNEYKSFLQEFITPTAQSTGQVGMRFASEIADSIVSGAISPIVRIANQAMEFNLLSNILTAGQATTLYRRKKITPELYEFYMKYGGYPKEQYDKLYQTLEPFPSIPDLILYGRYQKGFDNVWGGVAEVYDIDPEDYKIWEWLGRQRINSIQAQSLFKRGKIDEPYLLAELGRIGWDDTDREYVKDLSYILPNSMLLVQGGLIQNKSDDIILENISKGDIHPDYAQTYLDAVLTKPASIDIMAYELRQENKLANLPKELKKIGIHPDYTGLYETLAYQIPPVADIITMAVREAFTPEIAAKFGQYQDFPDDLEKYGAMKGLSKEWTQRYWAAHWALPSPQQGFEMLHRGVIDHSELNMLLRAQDVMPFWRDKLVSIAYRRLTRVDIRRMYKQGVLTEREVLESYLEHGYNPKNAERMTEFTIKQTLATLSKFTSGDIIKAFTNRMINKGEAIGLLGDIGIRREDANFIVSTAEYKRLWAFTDDQISGIRNLYKKRVYDENQARDKLARLNLPSDQIIVLMQQWHYEKIEELDATWTTAQTLKFLKRKLITPKRASRELNLNGYDNEHIDVLLRDSQWTAPKE
ncbi:hypothetical protein ES708_13410 [subsurface metagenome]